MSIINYNDAHIEYLIEMCTRTFMTCIVTWFSNDCLVCKFHALHAGLLYKIKDTQLELLE